MANFIECWGKLKAKDYRHTDKSEVLDPNVYEDLRNRIKADTDLGVPHVEAARNAINAHLGEVEAQLQSVHDQIRQKYPAEVLGEPPPQTEAVAGDLWYSGVGPEGETTWVTSNLDKAKIYAQRRGEGGRIHVYKPEQVGETAFADQEGNLMSPREYARTQSEDTTLQVPPQAEGKTLPIPHQVLDAKGNPLSVPEGVVPPTEPPLIPTEPVPLLQKSSKIGKSIEAKAVEAKLTQGFADTAGYDPLTIADQSQRATDLIKSSVPQARAIIRGEAPLPEGLRGTSVITAMEEHLLKNPDARMAYELANSPLTSATSAAAQEMRLMGERVPDSITAKFDAIKRARSEGAKLRGETPAKVTADITKEVVRQASKRPTWEAFVRDIVCPV